MTDSSSRHTPQGIVLLFVPVFIMLGPVLISPIIGSLFQQFAGEPYANVLVPLLLTAPALCLALCSPVAGFLANRIGGKKVLVFSLAFYGVVGAAPMFVSSLHGMLFFRILLGVAEAGIITGGMVLTASYFSGDDRQKWIAWQNVALPLIGAALLYAVGIVSQTNWQNTFGLYGLSLIIFVAAAFVLFEPEKQLAASTHHAPASKVRIPVTTMLLLAAIAIPGSLSFYAVPVKLSFILREMGETSPAVVGELMSMGLIFGSPAGALLARLVKHWRFSYGLVCAMLLMAAGLIMLGIAESKTMMMAAVIIQQAGGGLMLVVALTLVLHMAPKGQSGIYSGYWWLVYTLANFATPLVLTALDVLTGSSAATMLTFGVIVAAISGWLLFARPLAISMVSASDANSATRANTSAAGAGHE